jgi:hypothetical protein
MKNKDYENYREIKSTIYVKLYERDAVNMIDAKVRGTFRDSLVLAVNTLARIIARAIYNGDTKYSQEELLNKVCKALEAGVRGMLNDIGGVEDGK